MSLEHPTQLNRFVDALPMPSVWHSHCQHVIRLRSASRLMLLSLALASRPAASKPENAGARSTSTFDELQAKNNVVVGELTLQRGRRLAQAAGSCPEAPCAPTDGTGWRLVGDGRVRRSGCAGKLLRSNAGSLRTVACLCMHVDVIQSHILAAWEADPGRAPCRDWGHVVREFDEDAQSVQNPAPRHWSQRFLAQTARGHVLRRQLCRGGPHYPQLPPFLARAQVDRLATNACRLCLRAAARLCSSGGTGRRLSAQPVVCGSGLPPAGAPVVPLAARTGLNQS